MASATLAIAVASRSNLAASVDRRARIGTAKKHGIASRVGNTRQALFTDNQRQGTVLAEPIQHPGIRQNLGDAQAQANEASGELGLKTGLLFTSVSAENETQSAEIAGAIRQRPMHELHAH